VTGKIFANRKQCHYKTKRWQKRSPPTENNVTPKQNGDRNISVTLFTVGGDLPVTVQLWSDIVYCWQRSSVIVLVWSDIVYCWLISSCHRFVLKWHCLLLVEIFLSPFSFEVTLFTVGGDLPVTVQYWSDIVYCWSLQYLTVTGRSPPTVNNVTSKLNGDRKISTNSKQCHFKTKRWQEDLRQQ
jgi:hypothetical protein